MGNMRRLQRNNPWKRGLSILLSLLMLLSCIVLPNLRADATNYTQNSGNLVIGGSEEGGIIVGGTKLQYTETLLDNGDGTYSLKLTYTTGSTHLDTNTDAQISRNDYFVAPVTGNYLVEVWGGKGGDGQDTLSTLPILNIRYGSEGGKGGEGGHVAALVTLNAGDVLFYTLGGNGAQTLAPDEGGGVNGDGGHHGDSGSIRVGGGGGYSAVFMFKNGEFDKYLNTDGTMNTRTIDESDRTSKYILIAGGGGGGGGGNGLLSSDESFAADGGAGGYIGGISGQIASDTRPGIFYAGYPGKSSGLDDSYAGEGGTNEPGAIKSTYNGDYPGTQPNNWVGEPNSEYTGGAGGAGNLRGGAGGGGYCGGSGGVMTDIITANNIGGGGGGSSFVATIPGVTPTTVSSGSHNSSTGGAVTIAYYDQSLPGVDDNTFTVSGEISQYFTIKSINGQPHSGGQTFTSNHVVQTNTVAAADEWTVELVLECIDGFAGGNYVPVLADGRTIRVNDNSYEVSENCAYVNVPLRFDLGVQTYGPVDANASVAVTNLYTDHYSGIRGTLGTDITVPNSNPQYAFIHEIGSHGVIGAVDGNVTPASTTSYDVTLPVTVKNTGKVAEVGEPVGDTAGKATITAKSVVLVTSNAQEINTSELTHGYSKNLVYENGQYILSLQVDGSVSKTYTPTAVAVAAHATYNDPTSTATGAIVTGSNNTYSYSAPVAGYYLLQAWGGKGGNGGAYRGIWTNNGGTGGNGGYVHGYVYLEANETISFTFGKNGNNGADGILLADGAAGENGGYTTIQNSAGQYLLIAGGGGAGQGGTGLGGTGSNGGSASTDFGSSNTQPASLTAYSGQSAINFLYNTVVNVAQADNPLSQAATNAISNASSANYTNSGGGAVYISCIQANDIAAVTAENELRALPTNYNFAAQISSFFTVESVTAVSGETTVAGTSENGSVSVSGFSPVLSAVTSNDNTDGTKTLSALFNFQVKVVMSANTLGGNDIPVLVYTDESTGMSLTHNANTLHIAKQNATDYANVAIGDIGTLTTHDYTYVLGTDWNSSNLYNWDRSPTVDEAFLTKTITLTPSEVPPSQDTLYTVSATVAPTNAAQKAAVIPSIEGHTMTHTANVTVLNRVIYSLENLNTSDQPELVNGTSYYHTLEFNKDYEVVLTPAHGYMLPENVSVTVNGAPIPHEYFPDSGELYILAEDIGNQPVTIEATAPPRTFSIRFLNSAGTVMKTFSGLTPGEDIPIEVTQWVEDNTGTSDRTGYSFVWLWETDNGMAPTVMPGNDVWVLGTYVANPYNVILECYSEEDGNEVILHTETFGPFPFDSDYNIPAPQIEHYAASVPAIQGNMNVAADKTVRVKYVQLEGQLVIDYVKADGSQAYPTYQAPVDSGEDYSVSSPILNGYTVDRAVVSGTMANENGAHYTVTYTPNRYNVRFVDPLAADDAQVVAQWSVQYDSLFGYDHAADPATWMSWPQPQTIPTGKIFQGWYLDENKDGTVTAEDTLIKGDMPVTITADADLVALWKDQTYSLTVEYRYPDNTLIASEKLPETYTYNQPYSITPDPSIIPDRFTPEKDIYAGNMGNQDMVLVIVCSGEFDLIIHYVYYDTKVEFDTYAAKVTFGDTFSVDSPIVQDFHCIPERFFGTMDFNTMDPDEYKIETTVFYYEDPPIVSVTVQWSDLTFEANDLMWNPERHTYTISNFTPAGSNTVSVISNQETNVSVYTRFGYTPRALYPDITASFTDDGGNLITDLREIPERQTFNAHVNLSGSAELLRMEDFICGSCSVTLTSTPST